MLTLIRTEIALLARSAEFLVIAIVFPAVFFLVMSEVFGSQQAGSLDMVTYMMISMAAFGAISGAVNVGARVAQERQAGWTRQLRLTPLPSWSYVASKVVVASVVVLPAIGLILVAGWLLKGVDLPLARWALILLACWLGSLPFSAIGLLIGLRIKPDAVAAVAVTTFLMMAMFGGLWVPVEVLPGVMAAGAKALPSYWLATQARHLAAGDAVDLVGLAVAAAWFIVAAWIVVTAFRRDHRRA